MTALATGVGTWTVDVDASWAEFRAKDAVRKTVVGTLPVLRGTVEVQDGRVRVSAELDLAQVRTGLARRDSDLRGSRFFDVAGSPVLRFEGAAEELPRDGRCRLDGRLVLRGVACPVPVDVEVVEEAGALRVRATTSLDRRDAGIRVPRLLVGTRVDVCVEAVLRPLP